MKRWEKNFWGVTLYNTVHQALKAGINPHYLVHVLADLTQMLLVWIEMERTGDDPTQPVQATYEEG